MAASSARCWSVSPCCKHWPSWPPCASARRPEQRLLRSAWRCGLNSLAQASGAEQVAVRVAPVLAATALRRVQVVTQCGTTFPTATPLRLSPLLGNGLVVAKTVGLASARRQWQYRHLVRLEALPGKQRHRLAGHPFVGNRNAFAPYRSRFGLACRFRFFGRQLRFSFCKKPCGANCSETNDQPEHFIPSLCHFWTCGHSDIRP